MRSISSLGNSFKFLSKLSSVLAGIFLIIIALVLFYDMASRNLFERPIRGTVTIVETALVGLVFLGLGWAQREDKHVSFPLLTDRLPEPHSSWVKASGLFVAVIPIGLIWYLTYGLAVRSYQRGEATLGVVSLPVWPARALLTFGLLLLIIEVIRSGVTEVQAARSYTRRHR